MFVVHKEFGSKFFVNREYYKTELCCECSAKIFIMTSLRIIVLSLLP